MTVDVPIPCPGCAELREKWQRALAEQTRLSLLVQHARSAAVALRDALPAQQGLFDGD